MKQNHPPVLLTLVALVLVSLACQALASAQPGATQAPQQIETQASLPLPQPRHNLQ